MIIKLTIVIEELKDLAKATDFVHNLPPVASDDTQEIQVHTSKTKDGGMRNDH